LGHLNEKRIGIRSYWRKNSYLTDKQILFLLFYIVGKGYICRCKSISSVCTFICRQRGVSAWNKYTCWLAGYITKLTKKKNGKKGNKLRKELSHYSSMQCASHKTYILYIDIVLPFKQLLTLNQSHYQIVPVQISKFCGLYRSPQNC